MYDPTCYRYVPVMYASSLTSVFLYSALHLYTYKESVRACIGVFPAAAMWITSTAANEEDK